MQGLVQEVWSRRGALVGHHAGSLAWSRLQHVGREPEWPTRLWSDDGDVVAWGWVQLPETLDLVIDPERLDLYDQVLDWFEGVAPADELYCTPLADDVQTTAALEARGFVVVPDAPWFGHMTRRLDDVSEPVLPPGFTLRTVGPSDLERRVAVHRAAWDPSRVTIESYADVMGAWLYRPELDCVVEAPDGSFAAYALAWLDDRNGVGELEPVGTDPRFARLGLARAVCVYALGRLRDAGADTALVTPRGDEAYPAPKRLYESIGFRQVARSVEYRRLR